MGGSTDRSRGDQDKREEGPVHRRGAHYPAWANPDQYVRHYEWCHSRAERRKCWNDRTSTGTALDRSRTMPGYSCGTKTEPRQQLGRVPRGPARLGRATTEYDLW